MSFINLLARNIHKTYEFLFTSLDCNVNEKLVTWK